MTSASSSHPNYGSVNKWQRICYYDPAFYYLHSDAFCTWDSSLCLVPLEAAAVPTGSCLRIRGSPGTQEPHCPVCPSVCPPVHRDILFCLCLTCLRTSSTASFPSCHLLPRVHNWNVSFSLKNFIRLRN